MTLPIVELDPALHVTIRAAAACLFFGTAIPKLRDFGAFRMAVSGYALLPDSAVGAVAALLLAGEIAVGLCLLLPGSGNAPMFGAAALLSLYTAAIAINLARGRRSIDCGCSGPEVRRPLSGGLVARNVVLIAGVLLATLPVSQRSWMWVDTLTVLACAATLALLHSAAELAASHATRFEVGGGQ